MGRLVCPRGVPPLCSRANAAGCRIRAGTDGSQGMENRANVADDIFKEVDEDLRAERLRAAARRYGLLLAVLILAAVIGAGIWQFQLYRQRQLASATASSFFAATKLADSAGQASAAQANAAKLFGQVAARGPEGFRTLARFRQARIAWDGGQHGQALGLWDAVHDDGAADPVLRGLASLLWVQHQLDDGDPALLKSRLGALSQPGGAWRPMAQELDAEIDLRLGHVADARRKLAVLGEDGAAPEGVRNRAAGLGETLDTLKTGG